MRDVKILKYEPPFTVHMPQDALRNEMETKVFMRLLEWVEDVGMVRGRIHSCVIVLCGSERNASVAMTSFMSVVNMMLGPVSNKFDPCAPNSVVFRGDNCEVEIKFAGNILPEKARDIDMIYVQDEGYKTLEQRQHVMKLTRNYPVRIVMPSGTLSDDYHILAEEMFTRLEPKTVYLRQQ